MSIAEVKEELTTLLPLNELHEPYIGTELWRQYLIHPDSEVFPLFVPVDPLQWTYAVMKRPLDPRWMNEWTTGMLLIIQIKCQSLLQNYYVMLKILRTGWIQEKGNSDSHMMLLDLQCTSQSSQPLHASIFHTINRTWLLRDLHLYFLYDRPKCQLCPWEMYLDRDQNDQ